MIRCLSERIKHLSAGIVASQLFSELPTIEFRPSHSFCSDCRQTLRAKKSHTRAISTLHVGGFHAKETIFYCPKCNRAYRSEELDRLVPSGANFGYDVLVYAGQALWLRCRNEQEVVDELAQKNIRISPREVSLLGMKFIVYLAIAHRRIAADITVAMRTRGGVVCHLDATCEGRDPFLMSSIDSLSEIVLGNIKLPSEHQDHIVPFLRRIKEIFGVPLALVHDMGRGILKAVAEVFPGVPDFICHFHFLRDIGKDYMETEYNIIRTRLKKHQIAGKLRYRAKRLKIAADGNSCLIDVLASGLTDHPLPTAALQSLPVINAYTLIQWTLRGKSEGCGYGFPFDRPHLCFANRIRRLHADVQQLAETQLRGDWKDNAPYFKVLVDLKAIMQDKALWQTVAELEKKITVFERLREAMRIAPTSGRNGLNDEGLKCNIKTIERRVKKFRAWLTNRSDYAQNKGYRNMIVADGSMIPANLGVNPALSRTNNIMEQLFRGIKRINRRKTGNAASSRMLRTMLAETPLVRNLQNPDYMKILLNGKSGIEEVFAEIEIDVLRREFRKAQNDPEKIPAKLKSLIATPDYPDKLIKMVQKSVA